jgi:hypothetical protein
MTNVYGWRGFACCIAGVILFSGICQAQQQDRHALEIVRVATATELKESTDDHSLWMYRDVDRNAQGENVSLVVETSAGSVNKKIEIDGHRLTDNALRQEDARIRAFVNDPSQQAKRRKENEQDDKRATALLKMLPGAFLWKVKSDNGDTVTLEFTPNPAFTPPTLESRVFAAMAGEIIVNKAQNRIQTIKGRLTSDVNLGGAC